MNHPAVVVIAYNRAESLSRLLRSIAKADYTGHDDISLIISIDKGDNLDVIRVAEDFTWQHGNKQVIKREENMGLKAHVLACSSYASDYGSVIVLEDDLYVAEDFYDFAVKALDLTEADGRIAGISLYDHRLNVHAREPFEAIESGADNWYFQFPSSWGQAFTAMQWERFSEWMSENDDTAFPDTVPASVRSWDERSWLKYFIRYVIENDKYFLYPASSRTTNFTEGGTHRSSQPADFQVPLVHGRRRDYRFDALYDSPGVYDAYFESVYLRDSFKKDGMDVVIDLYGKKPVPKSGYFLSSQELPFKIIRGFGRVLRPLDANIIEDIPGDAFRLYDVTVPDRVIRTDATDKLLYNYRAFKAIYGAKIALRRLTGR